MSASKRRYQVFSEVLVCEEEPYTAYGLTTRSGAIHDISTDKGTVERMAALFNAVDLDPGRAGEAVETMLP